MNWQYPEFDFSAPLELVVRQDTSEENLQGYRSDFMRDRDRVLYCSSFRRLAGKTQIYLTGDDDHKRNRLTHTLEVSQIARTISRALGLDCDLTEAIALAHDLGHTPFGHAGEQILHEIMVPQSSVKIKESPMKKISTNLKDIPSAIINMYGFKHNIQSVRTVVTVEDGYGEYGLNLTNFSLWGIQNHSGVKYQPGRVTTDYIDPDYRKQYSSHYYLKGTQKSAWSFEAFVVRAADDIAQWHHDLEDALRGNAMTIGDVRDTIITALGPIMSTDDKNTFDNLKKVNTLNRRYITMLSKIVVNTLVNRIVECSYHNLQELWKQNENYRKDRLNIFVEGSEDNAAIKNAVSFLKYGELRADISEMQQRYPSVIREKIHHSMDVERMNAKGQYIIRKIFEAYWNHPQQLPDGTLRRMAVDFGIYKSIDDARSSGIGAVRMEFESFMRSKNWDELHYQIKLMRRICDHIAGMTDHFAMIEYQNLYG